MAHWQLLLALVLWPAALLPLASSAAGPLSDAARQALAARLATACVSEPLQIAAVAARALALVSPPAAFSIAC